MNKRYLPVTVATALSVIATGRCLIEAGEINPPPGPVGSTLKTLTDVEPRIALSAANTPGDADSLFRITQPGSYYLTGNVSGVSGKHGVEIAAPAVTLDLMGFQLQGVAGSLDGVNLSVGANNVAVRNGTVRDWGGDGVDLISGGNYLAEALRTSNNGGAGLRTGPSSNVVNCVAVANGSTGIVTGARCMLTHCTANGNGPGAAVGHGIQTSTDCAISHCVAVGNGGGPGGGNGIMTSNGCTITGCTVNSNGNAAATDNDGIRTASGSSVIDCVAILNNGDGIQVAFQSLVLHNNCIANGFGGDGAGIHATAGDNRIEGNNCTSSDRGIDVDAAGNVILRNTCSGNTLNWDVAANNKCLVVLGVNAGAISGDSGGVSPGSTDPNANFTF